MDKPGEKGRLETIKNAQEKNTGWEKSYESMVVHRKLYTGREHILVLSMKIELKDLNSDGNVGIKKISIVS